MNDFIGRVLFFFVVCLLLYYIGSTLHDMGRDKARDEAQDAEIKANIKELERLKEEAVALEAMRQRDAENRQTDAIEALITHAQKLSIDLMFAQSQAAYVMAHCRVLEARLQATELLVGKATP